MEVGVEQSGALVLVLSRRPVAGPVNDNTWVLVVLIECRKQIAAP